MRAIWRPGTTIATTKAGDLEGHKIRVQFLGTGRHFGRHRCSFDKAAGIRGYVVDKPMRETAWEIEFLRHIGVGDGERQTLRSWRNLFPLKRRGQLVGFRIARGDGAALLDLR